MKNIFLFLCSFLCLFQGVANELSWASPSTLSTAFVNASDPRIVMDADGNLVAAWIENGFVMVSSQPVGGDWSAASTLSNASASQPQLGVDSSGNVTAIWIENGQVFASTLPFGGSWEAATLLSGTGIFGVTETRMAVRSNGDIVVVWTRSGYIESATKLTGGAWSLVSTLSPANSDHPDVDVGANGTVVAVWHSNGSNGDVIMSASKTMGEAWGAAKNVVQLSTAFKQNYPKVSVDANGNADAICFRYQVVGPEFINVAVMASSLPLNSPAWTAIPTQLSGLGIHNPANLRAGITHDTTGNALALWALSYDDSSYTIESAMKLFGKAWSLPSTSLATSDYSFEGDISANSLGNIICTYMDFDGMTTFIQSAEANISGILSDILWSPSIAVSADLNNGYPRVASVLSSSNEVLAAAIWLHSDGMTTSVQAATGSRTTTSPVTNLAVVQDSSDFGIFVDYYNTLSWDPSPDLDIVEYAIYRNGILFKLVDPTVYSIVEHNAAPGGSVTYGVAAVDSLGTQSRIVTINYP